jgi:uncharacterized membrane protein
MTASPPAKRPKRQPHEQSVDRTGMPFIDVLDRNIRTLIEVRKSQEKKKGIQERAADAITRFSGSMLFVYLHILWIGAWIIVNLGWTPLQPFDPFPFGVLTLIASSEAIFLSTFVLISQNRMAAVSEKRAELDVQINLLSEHEITQVLTVVDSIAQHLGVRQGYDPMIEEAKNDVDPATVLEAIETYEHSLAQVPAFEGSEPSTTAAGPPTPNVP